jgi:hypothetical protein
VGDGGPAVSGELNNPSGIAVDSSGNIFVADSSNNRIRIITPDGNINTIAGDGAYGFGGDGGPAVAAHLAYPNGVAVDGVGNLSIADTDNQRIRNVTTDGIIRTVAGNGTYGFSGDGGASTAAQLAAPFSVAIDGTNSLVVSDTFSSRIRQIVSAVTPFAITDRGGTALKSDGDSASIRTGYGIVQADSTSTAPAGLAIYSYRSNNYLVSETSVPATSTLSAGRIYAEVDGSVDTGIALANPNNQKATIQFFFTDAAGNNLGTGTTTIGANQQIARFLDNDPFKTFAAARFQGTFSFTSDVPVAVVAIRGVLNERQDFLMSTLPVIDTTLSPTAGPAVVPHFTDGAGWVTEIILVNPTDAAMSGSAEFHGGGGTPAMVTVAGQRNTAFAYTIAPRSSQKLVTAGSGSVITSGSVRIIPANAAPAPIPLIIFSYKPGQITLSEAGVSSSSGTAFRMYAESSGTVGHNGSIQSGVAIANDTSDAQIVTFEVTNLDGSSAGLPGPVTQNLAGYGHFSQFLAQLFPGLPDPFKGVLRVSTASGGISVVGLRSRYNERGEFLITTTPPAIEAAPSGSQLVLPHLPDGGGYTTEFVLFSGSPGQTESGSLLLFEQSGQPFPLPLR